MTRRWTAQAIPDLSERTAVVTGADTGLGLEVARQLVRRGGSVIMAGNAEERALAAASALRDEIAGAQLEVEFVDLADLASVREFAERIRSSYGSLDLLINNAGIMFPPLTMTKDGFEGHFGINHLGHFALTGLVLDLLLCTPASRVVTVSSNSHKMGRLDVDSFRAENGYRRMAAYAQSKLANLLTSAELARRLTASGSGTLAVAAHPGQCATHSVGEFRPSKLFERVISQSVSMGALPLLRAATDPGAQQDDYFGPGGFLGMRGYPRRVERSPLAQEADVAEKLWTLSEELTGVRYDFDRAGADAPTS